jgi:hypothetical protein
MGNRRIGAQRLNALLKKGSTGTDSAYQVGASAKAMVASHNIRREGKLIVTEIAIDLGGNGSTIACTANADRAIGVKSSTGAAHLMQWENDKHGIFIMAEVVVVETANGETLVSLRSDTTANAVDVVATDGADILAAIPVNAVNIATTDDQDFSSADSASLADGEYVYITNDSSGAVDFTQGRIIIRLIGADNSWTF